MSPDRAAAPRLGRVINGSAGARTAAAILTALPPELASTEPEVVAAELEYAATRARSRTGGERAC